MGLGTFPESHPLALQVHPCLLHHPDALEAASLVALNL